MNEAFFKHAMKIIEELTDEDIVRGLREHGIEFTVKPNIDTFYRTCRINVPVGAQGASKNYHGHTGKFLAKMYGLPFVWFWSDKETKYQYHAIPLDWIVLDV